MFLFCVCACWVHVCVLLFCDVELTRVACQSGIQIPIFADSIHLESCLPASRGERPRGIPKTIGGMDGSHETT